MVLRVTEVQPLEGYRLRIAFNDGAVREVDFAEDLERAPGSLAEPLRDPDYFRQVRVDEQLRTIVWPNGLDADPDVLHGDRTPVKPDSLTGAERAGVSAALSDAGHPRF